MTQSDRPSEPIRPRPYHGEDPEGQGTAGTGNVRPLGPEWPLGRDPISVRKRIEMMEHLLERSFVVPGINRPVGLDSIVGLVPVVGDVVTAAMGAYIVWEARNLGMSKWNLWRMTGNVAFDTAIGAVPVAGDLFDFLFKSNTRNLRIVKKFLDKHHPESQIIDQ